MAGIESEGGEKVEESRPEGSLTFRDLKKQMTDELVKRSMETKFTRKILHRINKATSHEDEATERTKKIQRKGQMVEIESHDTSNKSSFSSIYKYDMDDDDVPALVEAGAGAGASKSSFDEDDLFMIIRKDDTKEILIEGSMVKDPLDLKTPSLCDLLSGGPKMIYTNHKATIGVQADSSDTLMKKAQPLRRCEGGESQAVPLQEHLSSVLIQHLKNKNLDAQKSQEKPSSSSSSGSSSSSAETSSKGSSSSFYSDTKDELKQAILKYGEVGPKRLTKDWESIHKKPTGSSGTTKPTRPRRPKPNDDPFHIIIKTFTENRKPSVYSFAPQPAKRPNPKKEAQPLPSTSSKKPPNVFQTLQKRQSTSQIPLMPSMKLKPQTPKRFSNYVNSKSFVSKGPTAAKYNNFLYHLSSEESKIFNATKKPMKEVPETEKKLLSGGQRRQYLEVRKEKGPATKYHYPEATSWRYGWLVDGLKKTAQNK